MTIKQQGVPCLYALTNKGDYYLDKGGKGDDSLDKGLSLSTLKTTLVLNKGLGEVYNTLNPWSP